MDTVKCYLCWWFRTLNIHQQRGGGSTFQHAGAILVRQGGDKQCTLSMGVIVFLPSRRNIQQSSLSSKNGNARSLMHYSLSAFLAFLNSSSAAFMWLPDAFLLYLHLSF